MNRQGHDGPLLRGGALVRGAVLFAIAVVLWGYCQDHHVHSLQGFLASVQRDLSSLGRGDRQPAASAYAKADIPPGYLRIYERSARLCPGLYWQVLAAVGKQESDHGRLAGGGVHHGRNSHGERGPMQFTDPAWSAYGHGGDPYDPGDAIPATARKLCHDGAPRHVHTALWHYNGAWSYADRVLRIAHSYERSR